MRLTPQEQRIIVTTVSAIFGEDSAVWLFGSRCDDNKHGGDVDLYIETPPTESPFLKRMRLRIALTEQLGEQKIDVVTHQRQLPEKAIHRVAKSTGIRLH